MAKEFNVGDQVTVPRKVTYKSSDTRWGTPPVAGKTGTILRVGETAITIRFSGHETWSVPMADMEPDVNAPALQQGTTAILPADAAERKKVPLGTGVLDYFPAALAEVAKISYAGNQQHNPGEPLHWARGKSTDQADTMLRHFLERGTLDSDGQRHSAKMCWRALAILQLELEAEGAPVARGAKS